MDLNVNEVSKIWKKAKEVEKKNVKGSRKATAAAIIYLALEKKSYKEISKIAKTKAPTIRKHSQAIETL